MIKINNGIIEPKEEMLIKIPYSNMMNTINLYIQYDKDEEDYVVIRLQAKFRNKDYYIADKNGKVKEYILDCSQNIIIPIFDIPCSDNLFIEIEFCKESKIENYGDLEILTKR